MKIGIIGGSGLDNPKILENFSKKEIDTPYGKPSSIITCWKISDVDVNILSRYYKNHEISPTNINFRANIRALKLCDCTNILSTSAVGSLKEEIKPVDLVFLYQFIDFTKHKQNTFYNELGKVKHTEMAMTFSEKLRKILINNTKALNINYHEKAPIVVIEGPRFSTKAESLMFRNYADIIGMITIQECILAKEAGLEYATIVAVTDYDCWEENEDPVTFEIVLRRMEENAEKVKKLLLTFITWIDLKWINLK